MLTIDRQVESDGFGTIWEFSTKTFLCVSKDVGGMSFETKETEGNRMLKDVESLWEKSEKI